MRKKLEAARDYIDQQAWEKAIGVLQEVLDAESVARLEPVFEPVKHKIAGAVRDLTDSSGDARIFAEELARVGREKYHLSVRLGTPVTGLDADGDRVRGAVTARGPLTADAYVLAVGVSAAAVARTVGVRLQVYPAKGYSSTFPIKDNGRSPTIPGCACVPSAAPPACTRHAMPANPSPTRATTPCCSNAWPASPTAARTSSRWWCWCVRPTIRSR